MVAAVLLSIGMFAMPKLIEWFIGGTVVGGTALIAARRRRRKADGEHRRNIEAETEQVTGLQQASDGLVGSAVVRATNDPQDAVEGLSIDERRARLAKVAGKLT